MEIRDGRIAATSSHDKTVLVWNLKDRRRGVESLEGHPEYFACQVDEEGADAFARAEGRIAHGFMEAPRRHVGGRQPRYQIGLDA